VTAELGITELAQNARKFRRASLNTFKWPDDAAAIQTKSELFAAAINGQHYSLYCIDGQPGTGKDHLAWSIAVEWKCRFRIRHAEWVYWPEHAANRNVSRWMAEHSSPLMVLSDVRPPHSESERDLLRSVVDYAYRNLRALILTTAIPLKDESWLSTGDDVSRRIAEHGGIIHLPWQPFNQW
jgi:phage pi2 protein 07